VPHAARGSLFFGLPQLEGPMPRPVRFRPSSFLWGASLLFLGACSEPPPGEEPQSWATESPLLHDAFVWQRRWTPAVAEAVAQPAEPLDGLIVLMGEIEWRGGPHLARSGADLELLNASEAPVGWALRVGVPPMGWGPQVADATVQAVTTLRAEAEQAGASPSELHLDIDVPTSRLDDYASWLPRVRAAWPEIPLTITGLPTWLSSEHLPAVLSVVDGWVLQVHWLDRSRSRLLDRERTEEAVAGAAALGEPFRVALPTYRSSGVRCEPSLLVQLLEAWSRQPPAHMSGVAWFRLPVDGERDALTPAAFEAVVSGRVPSRTAEVQVVEATEEAAPGTLDIFVIATGEDDVVDPCVELAWEGHSPIAIDGVRGTPESEAGRAWFKVEGLLRPGDEPRIAGWIRLAPGEVVHEAHVVDARSCRYGW
jgi:hypothetical protein